MPSFIEEVLGPLDPKRCDKDGYPLSPHTFSWDSYIANAGDGDKTENMVTMTGHGRTIRVRDDPLESHVTYIEVGEELWVVEAKLDFAAFGFQPA